MRANRRRDTTPELLLRRALHRAGARYRVDLPISVPGRRAIRPDVVFTRARVAVFVDGCFWHGCPEHRGDPKTNSAFWSAKIQVNQHRDITQQAALQELGWTVLRFWEHERLEVAVAEVLSAVAERSRSAE